jgi:alanine racemase
VSEVHVPYVELLGEGQSLDDLAHAAGTIAYEVLTSLGGRYQRRYIEGET